MAGRNRCGFVLTSGVHKGKKCNQGKGHDVGEKPTGHKYTPPKMQPDLNLEAIGANIRKAPPEVMLKHRRTRNAGERSVVRKFLDQLVQSAYDAWVESGKPSDWKTAGLLLDVPEDQVSAFKNQIHNSARYLDYRASFGTDEKHGDTVTVALRVTDLPAEESSEISGREKALVAALRQHLPDHIVGI